MDDVVRSESAVRAPVEFLAGHHDRQLVVCAGLERLALAPEGPGAAECARMVLDYLRTELPLHVADEETDLFPLLRERCATDDDIEAVLTQLRAEHLGDRDHEDYLLGPLSRIAQGMAPEAPAVFSRDALAFATMQRRHLAWENGAVLPLARRRLRPEDIKDLAARMTARRRGTSGNPR